MPGTDSDSDGTPVRLTAWVLLAATIAWSAASFFTLEKPGRILLGPICASIGMLVALILARSRPRWAAWLIVLATFSSIAYTTALTQAVDARFVGGFVIPVLLAGLLIGPGALVGTALLAVAARGALAYAEAESLIALPMHPVSPFSFWIHTSVLLLTAAAVGAIALRRWQRVAERAQRSEALYRILADNAADVIWAVDAEGRLAYVSPACERVLGFTPQQQAERYAQGLLVTDPADAEALAALTAKLRSGAIDEYKIEMNQSQAKEGAVWCEIQVRGIRDAEGRFRGVVGVTRDAARRHETELSNDRLRQALEQAGEAIAVIGPDGHTEFSNRAYAGLGPPVPGAWSEAREALRRGEPWARRIERILDGRKRVLHTSVTPVRDATGADLGLVSVTRDVTREVERDAEIQLAHKMQALGGLAGGIAHDFNNLLAVITGFAALLRRRHASDAATVEELGEITKAAELATSLTRQLLAAGQKGVSDARPIDLGEAVLRAAGLLRSIVREDVDLRLDAKPGAGVVVEIEPDSIQLVLVNLTTNARDAMPTGGQLQIRVRDQDLPAPDGPASGWVLLEVEDTGCGIPEDERERIFEPFYTTKAPGKGTGLGLASVYWAVSRSGGRIEVASQPGRGSLFRLWFPRSSAEATASRVRAAEPQPDPGRGTALVVEDQPQVRAMLRRVIEAVGWTVLEADSGSAALALVDRAEAPPDLLLTDVVMPGMSGIALASELRRRHPKLRVLLASGYPRDEMSSLGPELTDARFLRKPFQLSEIYDELRASLA